MQCLCRNVFGNRQVHLLPEATLDKVMVSKQSFSLIIHFLCKKKKKRQKKENPLFNIVLTGMTDSLNQTVKMDKATGDIYSIL